MTQFYFDYLLFAPLLAGLLLLLGNSAAVNYLGLRPGVGVTAAFTLPLTLGQLLCCARLLPRPQNNFQMPSLMYDRFCLDLPDLHLQLCWVFALTPQSYFLAGMTVFTSLLLQLFTYGFLCRNPRQLLRFQGQLQLFIFGLLLLVFKYGFGFTFHWFFKWLMVCFFMALLLLPLQVMFPGFRGFF